MKTHRIVLHSALLCMALLLMSTPTTFGCVVADDGSTRCAQVGRAKWRATPVARVAPKTPAAPAPAAKPKATAVPVSQIAQPSGATPNDAIPADDAWRVIGPGAKAWHRINIANVNHILDIWLDTKDHVGGMEFAVFSNYQADGGLSVNSHPVGRGTYNRFFDNDLRWMGRAPRGGAWYVLVGNNNSVPVTYKLGTNITQMPDKTCTSYWEWIGKDYVYWTACY